MAIPFERIKEILNEKSYKEFCKFMEGQTVSEDGVPEDDFMRFVLKLRVVD